MKTNAEIKDRIKLWKNKMSEAKTDLETHTADNVIAVLKNVVSGWDDSPAKIQAKIDGYNRDAERAKKGFKDRKLAHKLATGDDYDIKDDPVIVQITMADELELVLDDKDYPKNT